MDKTKLFSVLYFFFPKPYKQTFYKRIRYYITLAILLLLFLTLISLKYIVPLFNSPAMSYPAQE